MMKEEMEEAIAAALRLKSNGIWWKINIEPAHSKVLQEILEAIPFLKALTYRSLRQHGFDRSYYIKLIAEIKDSTGFGKVRRYSDGSKTIEVTSSFSLRSGRLKHQNYLGQCICASSPAKQ